MYELRYSSTEEQKTENTAVQVTSVESLVKSVIF